MAKGVTLGSQQLVSSSIQRPTDSGKQIFHRVLTYHDTSSPGRAPAPEESLRKAFLRPGEVDSSTCDNDIANRRTNNYSNC